MGQDDTRGRAGTVAFHDAPAQWRDDGDVPRSDGYRPLSGADGDIACGRLKDAAPIPGYWSSTAIPIRGPSGSARRCPTPTCRAPGQPATASTRSLSAC